MTDETQQQESVGYSYFLKVVCIAMCAAAIGVFVGFEAATYGIPRLHAVGVVVALLFIFYAIAESLDAIQQSQS